MSGGCGDSERDRCQYPVCTGHESLIESPAKKDLYVIRASRGLQGFLSAEKKPEWSLKTAGRKFRTRTPPGNVLGWIRTAREVWDYLLEVGTEAKDLGFDEVQLDYLRFRTRRR